MKSTSIMILAVFWIMVILVLAGCTRERPEPLIVTKEVDIPVGQPLAPPSELKRVPWPPAAFPLFVAPTDPRATSALTVDGEKNLRALMMDREARIDAWEKWGYLP
jgi:hypothetical protein